MTRRRVLAAFGLLLLMAILATAVWPRPKPDLYARAHASGHVRAAYLIGAPLFMVDPQTGQKSGIFHDAVESAAARLGWTVDWTDEVGYDAMIEGLESGRFDLVGSGVWITPERAQRAAFSTPLYDDLVRAYVRHKDARFAKGLDVLDSPSFRISVMDGELGAQIAAKDFPHAATVSLPQAADFTQLILNVVTRKADVVFLAEDHARAWQKAHPGQIDAVTGPPLRRFSNAIMLPKGQEKWRAAWDLALANLRAKGKLAALLRQYGKQ